MPPQAPVRRVRERARLALVVTLVLLGGCTATPRDDEEPWYVRGEIPVYEELVYWPQQEGGADDGAQCVPLSTLELENLAQGAQHDDLWQRVRSGFALEGAVDERRVDNQYDRFGNKQRLFDAAGPGTESYMLFVVQELEERNMPLELALLPMVESGYNPAATSRSQAAGMWQFIPGTGRRLGLEQNTWYDGRRDVVASTEVALDYLSDLHKRFGGDWYLALAAYNAGEGSVERAIERNRRLGKPTDYWSLPLSQQACNYVPKLLALSRVLESPREHGVSLAPLSNAPAVVPVQVEEQVDLRRAADRAGIDRGELLRLNPALKRGATLPSGTTTLLVPTASRADFVAALDGLPATAPSHLEEYRVRPGDSLQSVARLFETTPETLRALNALKGDTIIAGEYLHLPGDAVIPPRAFPTTESVDLKNRGIYVVKSGDSLWTIARRTGTSTAQLTRLNRLGAASVLQPGQQLRVRDEGGMRLDAAAVAADAADAAEGRQRVDYVVKTGDSLSSIASRFKVALSELMRWNSLDGARALIHPGQSLIVYIDPSLATRQGTG